METPKHNMPAIQIVADENIPSTIVGVGWLNGTKLVWVRANDSDELETYYLEDGTYHSADLKRYLIPGREH